MPIICVYGRLGEATLPFERTFRTSSTIRGCALTPAVVAAGELTAGKIAYNDQYMVYDFKPGRNTFIDATTGEVRFIDPRVDINDPGAGFSVSRAFRPFPF